MSDFDYSLLEHVQGIVVVHDLETQEILFMNSAGKMMLGNGCEGKKCSDICKGRICFGDECQNDRYIRDFNKHEEIELYNPRETIVNDVCYRVSRSTKLINGRKCLISNYNNIDEIFDELDETKKEREVYERILVRLAGLTLNGETYEQINKALVDIKDVLKSNRVSFIKYVEGKEAYVKSFKNEGVGDYEYNPIFRTVLASNYEWNRKYKDDKFIEVSIEMLDEYPNVQKAMKKLDIENFVLMSWEIDRIKYLLVVENVKYKMRTNKMYQTIYTFISFVINSFRYNKGLYNLSNKDTVTGLNNRNKYMIDLENKYKGDLENIGVIYYDLDGLKETNDAFGHDAGDKLLIDMSNILMLRADECDIYRFGGDEFIVIANGMDEKTFNNLAEELYKEIKFNRILCSYGSTYCNKCENIKDIINESEREMYKFKKEHHQRLLQQ